MHCIFCEFVMPLSCILLYKSRKFGQIFALKVGVDLYGAQKHYHLTTYALCITKLLSRGANETSTQ